MIFRTTKLGELATMKYGKMPPRDLLCEDGFPIFSGYRVTGSCKEYLYSEPQLVVVARGVGGTGDVKISPPKSWITNLSIVLDLDESKVCKNYLLYKLGLEPLKDKLNTGAAQAQITIESLKSYSISIPDIKTQKDVVRVISAYDDLIENNRRRIQLLEQSASLLYREWFVRLRFPGHERVKIKNGVPEGWEQKTVNELTSYLNRGITPKYDDDSACIVINQKCIRDRLINFELARCQSKKVSPEKLVKFGDVLVNSTGEGTLGRIAQLTLDLENCTVDSHITIVRPTKGVPIYYFGLCLTSLESYFSTMGRGATNQTELSRSTIGEIKILVPAYTISKEFERSVAPIFQQINRLIVQNKKLTEARDHLLPRLMNGEIAV